MIQRFKTGWQLLKKHSKLMLVVCLIVVFPLLFIFTFQTFITANKSNLNTVNTGQMSTFQDSIEYLLLNNTDIDSYFVIVKKNQPNLTELRIVEQRNNELVITHDIKKEKVGEIEPDTSQYRTALIKSGESYIFNYDTNNRKIAKVFRAVEIEDMPVRYIFTEHDLTKTHSIINSRIQKPYLSLTFIFLFLIILAYWIARQINYENKYNLALEKLRERDLFSNSLAHELRAPLTAVRGYASLILEADNLPQSTKDHADKIRISTARLVNLVNDFLEAARIQSGVLKVKRENFDAGALIEKVLTGLRPSAEGKSLKLESVLPNNSHILNSDSDRLEQILTNILSNSIKYTNKGTVKVTLKQSGKFSEFIVADSGNGISFEDQKRLFNPFVRVGSADKEQTTIGSGLGMWITKQLVEQLGGTISLESIKGVGTHVIIRLKRQIE